MFRSRFWKHCGSKQAGTRAWISLLARIASRISLRPEGSVEEDYTATIAALTYVTPWKILGGTYAVAVVPSMVAMDVDVGIGLPAITGPLGLVTIGPFNFETGRTNLAPGDTAFAPLVLGWNAGNFHWSASPRPATTAPGNSPTRA
jgi:hypothetical protein